MLKASDDSQLQTLYTRSNFESKIPSNPTVFALNLTASQIGEITNLNRNTVNRYLTLTHSLITNFCQLESPFFSAVECDQSYFGSRYKKGKRRRGAAENKHVILLCISVTRNTFAFITRKVTAKAMFISTASNASGDMPKCSSSSFAAYQ